MSSRHYPLLQALLMAGLSLFLAAKVASGEIYYYINERFLPLIAFGAAAALALAAGAVWRWLRRPAAGHEHAAQPGAEHGHTHAPARLPLGTVLLAALPLLLGALVPARPLGVAALERQGLNAAGGGLPSGGAGPARALDVPPEARTILDWVRAFNYTQDPAQFDGQPADVVGFVYHRPALPEGQFLVSRFVVTCCAADASGVALLAAWPESASLAENAWVRVRGPVRAAELDGRPIPLIQVESVEPTAQPDHPYMYP